MRHSLRAQLRGLRTAVRGVRQEMLAELRFGGVLRRAVAGRTGLKLNIGCGSHVEAGWLNLDAFHSGVDVLYFNALNPLPIAAKTVKRIHCEHFLEHLDFDNAVAFLKECYRVLEAGGTMRLIVPDADKYIEARSTKNERFFMDLAKIGNPSYPLVTPNMVINQMFRMGGGHRYAWDFETICHFAKAIGFASAERSALNAVPPEYAIDGQDGWREIESVYVELIKGGA